MEYHICDGLQFCENAKCKIGTRFIRFYSLERDVIECNLWKRLHTENFLYSSSFGKWKHFMRKHNLVTVMSQPFSHRFTSTEDVSIFIRNGAEHYTIQQSVCWHIPQSIPIIHWVSVSICLCRKMCFLLKLIAEHR